MKKNNANIRILLVSHDLSLTGAPKVLLWLAKCLLSNSHSVDLWSIRSGALEREFVSLGINPEYVDNEICSIENKFRQVSKRYDLIICNTIVTHKFAKAFQTFRTPVIWYIHESGFLEDSVKLVPELKKTLEGFYNIYTVSDYAKSIIEKYNKNVRVIPNGVEDTFGGFSSFASNVRFGFIGTISDLKGCDILISSFLNLVKIYPDVYLRIAGNLDSDFAKDLIRQTKDCSNIIWLGEVNDVAKDEFFNSIDVLCAPSIYDSCSLSVLEGVMKGKAIITTKTNGAKYVIKDGINGFLISPKDENALFDCMKKIVETFDQLKQRQELSREMYLSYAHIKYQENAVRKMLTDNINNRPPLKISKISNYVYKEKTETHKIYHIGRLKIKIRRKKRS